MNIYDIIKDKDFKVIIEAGGHVGQDTQKLCRMFPDAKVFTCEPIKLLYNNLVEMQGKFKNLSILNVALSDYDGDTDFYIDEASNGMMGASSILECTDFFMEYVEHETKITVPCFKLSTLIDDVVCQKVDFLWLDIEMMEYRVLKASEDYLPNIKNIYIELSYERFRKGQATPEQIDELLIGNGFTQVFIEPQGHPELGKWQANALYSRL